MRPPVPLVVDKVISRLEEWAEVVEDPQLAMELHMIRGGLISIRQDYDECASRRLTEIEQLSGFVAEGAQLRGESNSGPSSVMLPKDLRISSLERKLDDLRREIIDLQEWLEGQDDPAAGRLLAAILEFEHESSRSRASTMAFW